MLQFQVKDQFFETSLEAQEYADNQGTLLGLKKLAKDRDVSVDELLQAFGKTPTPTELGKYFSPPKVEVTGAKCKSVKFLTIKPYTGKQLDLFQKSQVKEMINQQLEVESEDWVQVTLQPAHRRIDYSIAPCFIPLFCKKLGVKLDAE